jgi:hypothetical protein
MAAAQIVIDQTGAPAGSPGLSRSDLALGVPVVLTNSDNTSVRVWRWALVASPPGSTAALTSTVGATTSFTPDIEGSYLIELQVNAGLSGERQRRIAAVETAGGLRFPVSGEGKEFNADGNTQGYGPDLDEILRDAVSGSGGVTLTDGTTSVPATTIELDPAFFEVANGGGGVGEATLADRAARSVFGRAGGTSGPPADIVAGADNTVLARVSGSLVFTTISTTMVDQTYLDIDVTAEPTTALANGALSIGGIPFTVDDATLAGAGSGLVNGTGLSLRAPTNSSNTWTLASQAAPHLYTDVTNIPGFVPGIHTLIIDMHLGAASVFENGNDAVRMGFWALINTPLTGAAARARIADRGNSGGTQTLRTFDGTSVGSTAVDVSAFNSYSVIIPPAGDMIMGVGTYSGGWPTRFTYFWRFGTLLTTDSVLAGDTMRFLLAFINVADLSPTSRADVAHLRFRKAA